MLVAILTAGIVLLFAPRLARFVSNYAAARQLGLPILITPVSWQDPLWMLFGRHFEPLLTRLPFGVGDWARYATLGWSLHDRHRMHTKLGPAFVLVTPSKNEIIVADPAACEEILSRWKVWTKPPEIYAMFNMFGKNVNSVNGDDWTRHRKITAPAFKEANSRLVWTESIRQAEALARLWSSRKETTLQDLKNDSGLLAMHVLAFAGFGKQYDFETGLQQPEEGHVLSYGSALSTILLDVMSTILVTAVKAPNWALSRYLIDLKASIKEFRTYISERAYAEREELLQGRPAKDNLMSTLVRANEAAKHEKVEGAKFALTDDELYGNIFMFNLAGFETTTSALAFSLSLLAAHPEIQDWIREEVDQVMGIGQEISYDEAFPRLVRCFALLREELRVFGAAQEVARNPADGATHLTIGAREYLIPPNTYVVVNFAALHSDPQQWGPDVDEFKPSRWVTIDAKTQQEVLAAPPNEARFLAWSVGPRVCPGKKFSQVEFVAVVATLVRSYRIEPARRGGEAMELARARVARVVRDVVFNLAPNVRKPMDAGLVLVKR